MDAPMAVGTPVRQVVKPIEGVVTDIKFNAQALSFEYLVVHGGGERWFSAADVAAIPAEEEAAQ